MYLFCVAGQFLRWLLSPWCLVDHTFSHLNTKMVLWQQDFANITKKSVSLKMVGLTYSEQERDSTYAGSLLLVLEVERATWQGMWVASRSGQQPRADSKEAAP